MEEFCNGDETAFNGLYGRYSTRVLAFLARMVRDQALAEDLVQTTFLSLVRSRGRYEKGTAVRSWIYAIAANAGRDALRRRRSRREAGWPSGGGFEPAGEPLAERDPAAVRAIELALGQLPVDQREAVILHKLHELSFGEIAQALGISEGAAKVRAHRGYTRLRTLLGPVGGLPS